MRIFWGSERGYLLSRFRDLGIPGALALEAADFDADGARDLAILLDGGRVRILWATPSGQTRLEETELRLPGKEATCLAAADYNRDGQPDLLVGSRSASVYLVAGGKKRTWGRPRSTPAFEASHIGVGDLNGDGWADLLLTRLSLALAGGGEIVGAGQDTEGFVRVLWGDAQGFSRSRALELSIPNASASAVGDLDADGHADLAVAIYQGALHFRSQSRVYFGTGDGKLEKEPIRIGTEGTSDVTIVPPEPNLPARVVFCNSRGGTLQEKVPLYVYWGQAGGFDPANCWEIPFQSGYEASAADLNADGYPDLVTLNSGHAGEEVADPTMGANIFWGSPQGFDQENRRTVLSEFNLGSSNVADLDRDGFLDLVLGAFDRADRSAQLVIYYGSEKGVDSGRKISIPSEGRSTGALIADFNQDRWLDIAVSSTSLDRVRIFWNGPDGFREGEQSRLDVPYPIALESADFNRDGYLDLVVGSYYDPVTHHHDTGSLIFWGGQNGFRYWDSQWLPGFTPVGLAAADFDGDGFLDLFSPHYHAELTRESLPNYLYWGGPEGFTTRGRTSLICNSAHDAMAGDFNQDGRLDLAVSCHTSDGDHRSVSRVFYNDGRRFADPDITELPTIGPHWMYVQDVGHIYHRRWEQTYESSVFAWQEESQGGQLQVRAEVPGQSGLSFEVRSAGDGDKLSRAQWRRLQSESFSLQPKDRVLQYRATFRSDNGDRYPRLDRVEITLKH